MSVDRLVVVGASLAGMRAAQAARRAGYEGELIVVGDERHRPYTRPPLSKELLSGAHDAERTALPGRDRFDADWRLGHAATALDRERKVVVLEDGAEVGYDRLVIATGSRARTWPGPGAGLDGVFTLRRIEDSLALREAIAPGVRLAIVGAGFIGCEVAATARGLEAEVTLIDVAEHPLVPLGATLGTRWAERHAAAGVELRLGTGVDELVGDEHGRFRAVRLAGGEEVEADIALVALGVRLNTEWLSGSGLELDETGAVVCDETLTSVTDPDVLAAGDIASWPHPLAGGERIRVEHWTTAAEHGALAGANALQPADARERHISAPYFWSDQYELKIQAAGLPGRADRLVVLEQDAVGERLVMAGVRDGRLVGVVGIGAVARINWYRRQLDAGAAWDDVRAAVGADEKALGPGEL